MKQEEIITPPDGFAGVVVGWKKSLCNAVSRKRKRTGEFIVTCTDGDDLIVLYPKKCNIHRREG